MLNAIFNCSRFAAHRAEWKLSSDRYYLPRTSWTTCGRALEKLMKAVHNMLRKEELRRKVINNNRRREISEGGASGFSEARIS